MATALPSRPQLSQEQQAFLDEVAAAWRESSTWPRANHLDIRYRKRPLRLPALLSSLPPFLWDRTTEGGHERIALTLAGVSAASGGGVEADACLGLIRRGVARLLEHPFEAAANRVTQDDLMAIAPDPSIRGRVKQLFDLTWTLSGGANHDGSVWHRDISIHEVCYASVASAWDLVSRKARRDSPVEGTSEAHRELARRVYRRWHNRRAWPNVTELVVEENVLGDVYQMLRELPGEARREWEAHGRRTNLFTLRFDGIVWAVPEAPEPSVFVRLIDALRREYERTGEERIPVEAIARDLGLPADEVTFVAALLIGEQINIYLNESSGTFSVGHSILDLELEGIASVPAYQEKRNELQGQEVLGDVGAQGSDAIDPSEADSQPSDSVGTMTTSERAKTSEPEASLRDRHHRFLGEGHRMDDDEERERYLETLYDFVKGHVGKPVHKDQFVDPSGRPFRDTEAACLYWHDDGSVDYRPLDTARLLVAIKAKGVDRVSAIRKRRALAAATPSPPGVIAAAVGWDIFISHASEDKDDVARPLAILLGNAGLRVWFDEHTLALGDSLLRKIDEGLRLSRYGAVILSPSFFAKDWPARELDGMAAREFGGQLGMHEAIKRIRERLDFLIEEVHSLQNPREPMGDGAFAVDEGRYAVWRMSCATVLKRLVPGTHYDWEFDKISASNSADGYRVIQQMAILVALRRDFDAGMISDLRGLVRAEVFVDFIEQADHLFEEGYWICASHRRNRCTNRVGAFESRS